MARIILIETSTARCSVGLAEDGVCTHYIESPEPRSHASMTAPFVKAVLDEAGLTVKDCDAVCVSKGPGSYTGLRVGSSTAKGLCFGASLPLLSLGTLDILAAPYCHHTPATADSPATSAPTAPQTSPSCHFAQGPEGTSACHFDQSPAGTPSCHFDQGPQGCVEKSPVAIIPMIDARRMEVYCAVFSPDGRQLTPTASTIITPDSFAEELARGPVLFIGDGALKCRPILTSPNALFPECASRPTDSQLHPASQKTAALDQSPEPSADPFVGCPRASAMAGLAEAAFRAGRFEDTAYFEPFYLKDFIATVPRKKLW